MFASIKGNSLFARNNNINNNNINNVVNFNNVRFTKAQWNNAITSSSFARSFSTGTPFTPRTPLTPNVLNIKNEEEEGKNRKEKQRQVVTNNWLAFLASLLGLTAFSLLSADEKKESKKANEEAALSPDEWRALTLSSIQTVNHNTSIFRFAFDNANQLAGLTVASCLVVRVFNEETQSYDVRPYTPVSSPDAKGYLDLIIKKYDNGKVTPKIFALKVGDKLEFQGPWTKIKYTPNMKKEIGMIAGGTGITPMLQVLKEILKNKEDKTKVSLIFANITENDILLRSELDQLAAKHDNFKVYYTLDRPSENWKQGRGFVSEQMIKEHLPAPADDKVIFVCGPDPMLRFLAGPKGPNFTQGDLSGLLANLGYSSDQVFKF